MGIKDQAKRLAAGASVALATSGLTNCKEGGGFCDPAPGVVVSVCSNRSIGLHVRPTR